MGAPKKVTDKEVREALIASGGVLARAVQEIKRATGKTITRSAIVQRCTRQPELQAVRDSAREEVVDYAEEGLFAAVKSKAPWAIKYVLSRLGKERGYTTTFKVDAHVESSGKVVIMLPDNGRDKPNG